MFKGFFVFFMCNKKCDISFSLSCKSEYLNKTLLICRISVRVFILKATIKRTGVELMQEKKSETEFKNTQLRFMNGLSRFLKNC